MNSEQNEMRAAFEVWCKGRHSLKRHNHDGELGSYIQNETDFAWEAFQTAYQLQQQRIDELNAIVNELDRDYFVKIPQQLINGAGIY